MKQIALIAGTTISLITLFCLQLCLLKYEHTINFNLLLILYSYSIFRPLPTAITAILIIMLDGLNFIMTGHFGQMAIILTVAAWGLITIKDNFYNKLVMPISCIFSYYLLQQILLKLTLQYPFQIVELLTATLMSSLAFIFFWWMTKQPFHD